MTQPDTRVSLADLTELEIDIPVTSPSDVLRVADQAAKLAYAQTCGLRDLLSVGRKVCVTVEVLT